MNQVVTKGIVLTRTNFQEADRILTLLTPGHGKIRVIAKGVRRAKSKLAGGVELFSVSDITFIPGKGEIHTLISSRLIKHYGTIVQQIERTMLGYELIKLLNKATEDAAGPEYFELLKDTLDALDHSDITLDLIKLWFYAQLLRYAGHMPNLRTEKDGNNLEIKAKYNFDYDNMVFISHPEGQFVASHIKFLRLAFSGNKPAILRQVQQAANLTQECLNLLQLAFPLHIRV